jgi:DNA-binding NtrC family response regulator
MKARILVVESDELKCQRLKAKLAQEGYDAEVISCSQEDLDRGLGKKPALGGDSANRSSQLQLLTLPSDLTADESGYTSLKKKWSANFEKEYLTAILDKHEGNVSAAARESKLDRSNFLRLLRRHGIKAQAFREEDELKAA